MISLLTELGVLLVLRTRRFSFRSRPSRPLLWTTVAMSVLALATPYLGPLSAAFGFVPLSASEIAVVVAIVIGYVAATEAAKIWFYRDTLREALRTPSTAVVR